eukprot:TRINITY_DN4549_c2_g2_i1.p1 TRINITY_DN4549_c2_g2~~TRINITY_DN4549_c2_g2_i1.p1  ORF type:complete len:265 (+),score=21.80 TRINITY_DN4549_c2_g2_i1:162-956(+)
MVQNDLFHALSKHTNGRNATEYVAALRVHDVKATADLLNLTSQDLSSLKLTPHLRQVCSRVRNEKVSPLAGTPLEGVGLVVLVVAVVLGYFLQMSSMFDVVERIVALMILCLLLTLMLCRSMYVLFSEESLGTIKVTRNGDDSKFTAKITTATSPTVYTASGTGDSVGVLFHEVLLSPFLNYIGFESRISWSSVAAVDDDTQKHTPLVSLSVVSHDSWTTLERLPWIPGVRAIERKLIMKSAPDGASFILKKNITGLVWIEQES